MKNKILNLSKLALLISVFSLSSCDEEETVSELIDFNENNFVAFNTTEVNGNELTTEPITITATYAIGASSISNISVGFTINSEAVEGIDYVIENNKTTFDFSSSNYTDSINIIPIDNLDEDGNKVLTITLNSNNVNVGYPGPNNSNKTVVVTIIDNDCGYTLQELGDASWVGSDNAGGNEGPNASQISTSYDGTSFLIEGISYGWLTNPGFWEEVVTPSTSTPVLATFDLVTNEINIDIQYLCTTTWLGDTQPDYSISATGEYIACSGTMIINYDLYQNGAILRSYTETITKQ